MPADNLELAISKQVSLLKLYLEALKQKIYPESLKLKSSRTLKLCSEKKNGDSDLQLVYDYGMQLVDALKRRIDVSLNDSELKELMTAFLKHHYQEFGSTAVGYIAKPNATTTDIMRNIACLLSDEENSPFNILMPGALDGSTDSIQHPNYRAAVSTFKSALENPDSQEPITYTKEVRIPLTHALLEKLDTALTFEGAISVASVINALSIEDIPAIFSNKTALKTFFDAIHTSEQAYSFIKEVSSSAFRTVFNTVSQRDFVWFLGVEREEFIQFLKSLDKEKQKTLIQTVIAYQFRQNRYALLFGVVESAPELLELVLKQIPEALRLSALQEREIGAHGRTLFHLAAYNDSSLQTMLTALPENMRLRAVTMRDCYDKAVLHDAASSQQTEKLKIIFNALSEEDCQEVIRRQDFKGENILHKIAFKRGFLQYILTRVPSANLLEAVKQKNERGQNVLHCVTRIPERLELILGLASKDECLAIITAKDKTGATSLHYAAMASPESLKSILNMLPEEEWLNAIKAEDIYGNSALHMAAYSNPEGLKTLLELYPVNERLEAIKKVGENENTVLQVAARNHKYLEIILKLCPVGECSDMITERNVHGKSAFDIALSAGIKSTALLLKLLSGDEIVAIFQNKITKKTLLNAIRTPELVYSFIEEISASTLDAIFKVVPPTEFFGTLLTNVYEFSNNRFVDFLAKQDEAKQLIIIQWIVEHQFSQKNYSLLWDAAPYPKLLKLILRQIPESERQTALNAKSRYGDTILYLTATYPESLDAILAFLPENNCREAIKEKNGKGKTLLHKAASNHQILEALLKLFPMEERFRLLTEKDVFGRNVFHYAVLYSQSVSALLSLLSEAERLEAFNTKDGFGDTALNLVADYSPNTLKTIIESLSEDDRLEAINTKNRHGYTALHLVAASHPESLKSILESLSKDERLKVIKEKDGVGNTILHRISSNPKNLDIILNLYSIDECTEVFKEKGVNSNTVLHLVAVSNPESLNVILTLIPKSERLEAIKVKNIYGENVLHRATSNTESLKIISKLCSQKECLEAAKEQDKNGQDVLDKVTHFPEKLVLILELYPKEARLEAITTKKHSGKSVLDMLEFYPKSLEKIFSLLSEDDCLKIVKKTDKDGNTLLHSAEYKLEKLKVILNALPEHHRLEAVIAKNRSDQTVLDIAVSYPECLAAIFSSLAENDRLKAIEEKDKDGNTILHKVIHSIRNLTIILESLPKENRLEAVIVNNHSDQTVLDMAARYPKCLKAILLSLNTEAQFNLFKSQDTRNILCKCLSELDDASLTEHPLLMICKRLLKQETQSGPRFFEKGQRLPSLDEILSECQSYQDLYQKTNQLLETDNRPAFLSSSERCKRPIKEGEFCQHGDLSHVSKSPRFHRGVVRMAYGNEVGTEQTRCIM